MNGLPTAQPVHCQVCGDQLGTATQDGTFMQLPGVVSHDVGDGQRVCHDQKCMGRWMVNTVVRGVANAVAADTARWNAWVVGTRADAVTAANRVLNTTHPDRDLKDDMLAEAIADAVLDAVLLRLPELPCTC